jgi:carbamoyl-phosphate synthase large subunit
VPCLTTLQAAEAAVRAMEATRHDALTVQAVQERFPEYGKVAAT